MTKDRNTPSGDAAPIPALPNLAAIKERVENHYGGGVHWDDSPEIRDIKALLAEVERLRLLVPSSQPETPTELLRSILNGLEVILRFSRGEGWHDSACSGGDDGPCDCGFVEPRHVCEALIEQVSTAIAALPVVLDEAPKAALQRYERDVVSHVGGHYGEEQWQTTEMVPCETGAWVKWRDVAALGASRPSPADMKSEEEIIEEVRSHWFIQGGKMQFGMIPVCHNADEIISAILSRVRNPQPDAPSPAPKETP